MSLPHCRLASSSQVHILLTRLQPQRRRIFENLQGCFRVSYRFVEDGRRDFEIKDALEWITLKQRPGAYLIQHYELIGVGEVIQHFAETWSLLQDGHWRQDVGPSRYTCISEVRIGQFIAPHPAPQNPLATKDRPTICSTACPLFKSRRRAGSKTK